MNINNKKVQKKMLLSKSFHLKATTNKFSPVYDPVTLDSYIIFRPVYHFWLVEATLKKFIFMRSKKNKIK